MKEGEQRLIQNIELLRTGHRELLKEIEDAHEFLILAGIGGDHLPLIDRIKIMLKEKG